MNQSRILVVEDEAIVTMEIEERLAAMGYKVAGIVSSGEQALNLAREQRPDLVLMDIRLDGDMDGISATEEIRKQFQVPVIFLTAYSEDSTLERAKRAEPYGYLLKPFDDRELRSTIEIALYKHRTEEELRRMNRLYDVLSQVNQTVVRTEAREELFDTVCHMVVERGTMDLAWIGCLDAQKSHIHPVASFGNHSEKLSEAKFCDDSSVEAGANLCKTVKEGKPFVCNECGKSPCPYPHGQSPERFGFQSCASFPLWFQGGVFGALNVCVQEPGFFAKKKSSSSMRWQGTSPLRSTKSRERPEGNMPRSCFAGVRSAIDLRWRLPVTAFGIGICLPMTSITARPISTCWGTNLEIFPVKPASG